MEEKKPEEQGVSPFQFYAPREQMQAPASPIEPQANPTDNQARPKTKMGRNVPPADVVARAPSPDQKMEQMPVSPPIFVEGSHDGAFEVTGETQNILIMDDRRDESKPSVPSGQSGQSVISAPSGQTTNRDVPI